MNELTKNLTKDKILRTAAKMFSEKGYNRVTTREIAKAIGINSASIYYHFSSKEDIRKSLYQIYSEKLRSERPNLNELLQLVETKAPHEVLMNTEFHFSEEWQGFLDQILVTAAREITADPDSERFIKENIFDSIENVVKPLLIRLVELGKIKPFDINAFVHTLSYYCFSAAALNNSSFGQNVAEYQAGMSLLFSSIVFTERD